MLFRRPCSTEPHDRFEAWLHCVLQRHKVGSVRRHAAEQEHASANLYFAVCVVVELEKSLERLFQDVCLR